MSTFGTVVGLRSDEGREEFRRYHSAAIEVPSTATSSIESISRDTGIFLVVGVIERDGGTLYCTVIFVDPAAGYLSKHRKLMPTGTERLIWGLGDASTLPIIEKSFTRKSQDAREHSDVKAKITATICW